LIGLAAALLVIGGIVAALSLINRGSQHRDTAPLPTETARTIDSLAILPLLNVTGDSKADPLCETIAEEVSSSLAQMRKRKLRVRPITSTIHYKSPIVDIKRVGRELEVQGVITGTLRKDGNNLTIRLQLVDAVQNDVLWPSREYKRNLDEILLLQQEITQDVALNLGLVMPRLVLPGVPQQPELKEKQPTRRYTNDPAAYLLFREGRYEFDQASLESRDLAIKHFQAAIKKDPEFALAYAWLAHAYLSHRRTEENRTRALEAAAQALLLDENLAEGYAALGTAHFFLDWDWQKAQKEFRQALDLDPKNSNARHIYGYTLAVTGKVKEAIGHMERAVKDDPRYLIANGALAQAYLWDKRYEDAIVQSRKTLDISPTNPGAYGTLGMAYVGLMQYDHAVTAFQEALKLSRGQPLQSLVLGWLGYCRALAGNHSEAEKLLRQLQSSPPNRPFRAYGMAAIYAGLGDKDQAFHWLNESRSNRDPAILFLKVGPPWESLRNDPRFDNLLRRLGLIDSLLEGREDGRSQWLRRSVGPVRNEPLRRNPEHLPLRRHGLALTGRPCSAPRSARLLTDSCKWPPLECCR
jgi:TolB-like protein/tetratricopeptide (TPR) repeat protein